jgi:uncharacterized protein (DUF4415 family)
MTDSEHIVRHERKPLSAEQIARLKAAADRSDEEIDFSDIPDADAGSASRMVRGMFYRPVKKQITLRLDAHVLEWFRQSASKGYQTDINRVLRDYVEAQEKKARGKQAG